MAQVGHRDRVRSDSRLKRIWVQLDGVYSLKIAELFIEYSEDWRTQAGVIFAPKR